MNLTVWRTRKGEKIPIKKMETSHIENVLVCFRKLYKKNNIDFKYFMFRETFMYELKSRKFDEFMRKELNGN